MPTGGEGGGGDAAPADSGADASVRLAGRTARTRLTDTKFKKMEIVAKILNFNYKKRFSSNMTFWGLFSKALKK
jgi:hypothetical protein